MKATEAMLPQESLVTGLMSSNYFTVKSKLCKSLSSDDVP